MNARSWYPEATHTHDGSIGTIANLPTLIPEKTGMSVGKSTIRPMDPS